MDKSNIGQVTKALDNLQVSGILYRMWLTLSLHLAGLKVICHKLHLIQTSANLAEKRLNLEHLTQKYLMMSGSSYDIYPFVQCTFMSWNLNMWFHWVGLFFRYTNNTVNRMTYEVWVILNDSYNMTYTASTVRSVRFNLGGPSEFFLIWNSNFE